MARAVKSELPADAQEVVQAAAVEFSEFDKQQEASRAYVGINTNWAKIFGIWAVVGTGIAVMMLCAAMLVWLLYAQMQNLLNDADMLASFLSELWEVLSNASIGVLLSIAIYFARQSGKQE